MKILSVLQRFSFLILAFIIAIPFSGQAQMPSCENFAVGINEDGKSVFTVEELLKNKTEFPYTLTIRAESQALIFEGEIRKKDDLIELELCEYVDNKMEYRLRNVNGSCQGILTVSAPPLPKMKGRNVEVFVGDPLIKKGSLIGDTFPVIDFPCGNFPVLKVADETVESFECGDTDQHLQKKIYRVLEGEDQWGRSFSAVDTILIYKFPEVHQENFTNQSIYHLQCGYSENFGPHLIYKNPLTDVIDTVQLIRTVMKENRMLEFETYDFPEDYGIQMDLKVNRIKNTKCEKHYQVALQFEQLCFSKSDFRPGSSSSTGINGLSQGRFQIVFEVLDQDTIPPGIGIDEVVSYSNTSSLSCEGRIQFPDITIEDNCSGVRRAQATVAGHFTVDLKRNSAGFWQPVENVVLPFDGKNYIDYDKFDEPVEIENAHKVIVESADSCNLVIRDSFYIKVVDEVSPSITLLNNVRVGMVGRLTWLDVENLNGNSYDNCGITMVLGRRKDWETAGPVNLCDGLETDKRINPVEAYYSSFMAELEKGNDTCGHWLFDQWNEHLDLYCSEGSFDREALEVGGGWTTQIPFTCEDVCQEIEVEILIIDASCNWSIARSRVKVQEKQPVQIVQDVEQEISLNCSSFGTTYAEVVEAASRYSNYPVTDTNRIAAFRALDSLLGGYHSAWQDLDGQLTFSDGSMIAPSEHKIEITQNECEMVSERKEIEYFDERTGRINTRWEMVPNVKIKETTQSVKDGIVAVNCSSSIYQKIHVDIDDCGAGVVKRRFYVASGCGEPGNGDWLEDNEDRIEFVREQTIYVTPDCELSEGMFELPSPVIALDVCEMKKDDDGNYKGLLHPDFTGWPEYKWSSFCREISVSHEDKLYQLMGNNAYGQWKLVRRWYMEDRCESSGQHSEPVEYEQIIIINEVEDCDGLEHMRMISGQIESPVGTPLPDVDVIIESSGSKRQRATTSIQGTYSLPVDMKRDYTIRPSKTDELMKGVSTFDLVLIQNHILNREELKDPYQLIAADINNNGVIDPGDIIELQRGILRPDFYFTNNDSYRFIEPLSGKEIANISDITEDQEVDFIGIKIGDVNLSSYKLTRNNSRSNRAGGMKLILPDLVLSPGQSYRIPVRSADLYSILGFQFSWELKEDAIESIQLDSGEIPLSRENYARPDDYLTFSWFDVDEWEIDSDAVLFYLELKVNRSVSLKDVIRFDGEMLSSESYVEPGMVQGLEFSYQPTQMESVKLHNRPNPFRDRTTIQFFLDDPEEDAILSIHDMTGKEVYRRKFLSHRGNNELDVEGTELPHAGMYYYIIVSGKNRFAGKMIHIR